MHRPRAASQVAWGKFDPALRKKLEGRLRPGELLHVMVRMPPDASEDALKPEPREARFRDRSADLHQQLERERATEIQLFWINSTVGAVVRPESLGRIGSRADVTQVILMVRYKAVL